MKIITGRKYTDTNEPQIYDVVEQRGAELHYVDRRTGGRDHVRYENGIVYAQSLMAGDYYPTNYTVEA